MYKKYFAFLKQKQIQLIINKLYREPKSYLRLVQRFGGYIAYKQMIRDSKRMKLEASLLAPVHSYPNGLPVYFLTGKQFLFQTLFCIKSLAEQSHEKFKFTLVDDGTFDVEIIALINKLLPGAQIIGIKTIIQNLDSLLPTEKYPVIRQKRLVYNHLKKITDIHTFDPTSYKLILDSDMLFWNEPTEVIDWLKNPQGVISISDSTESYGYSIPLMEKLCGSPITRLLNVGLIGFNSASIDWNKIEKWIAELEEKEGASYFLEQALTAMVVSIAGNEKRLKKEDYIVNPTAKAVEEKCGILHHYVDLSKKDYFITAWKHLKA